MSSTNRSRPAPGYREQPLTVGCVQFDPKLRDVESNAARIRELTKRIEPDKIDLLVLPEMALTGYNFTSLSDIQDLLEDSKTGRTATLGGELARRMKCWVIAGFPEGVRMEQETENDGEEDLSDDENTAGTTTTAPSTSTTPTTSERKGEPPVEDNLKAYNSAVIVSPTGQVVGSYRKSFLFETDKAWAEEGEGFKVFDLPQPLGRTVVGICMDMNPKDFLAPFNAYELANFVQKEQANLVVVPMNWLNPPEELPPSLQPQSLGPGPKPPRETGPDIATLNYWASRLTPLHDPAPGYSPDGTRDDQGEGRGNEVVFVSCNRVGVEKGTTFVGTSCVMTMSSSPSSIDLIEAMGVEEEGVMFALVN